jgi:hypothetical protein
MRSLEDIEAMHSMGGGGGTSTGGGSVGWDSVPQSPQRSAPQQPALLTNLFGSGSGGPAVGGMMSLTDLEKQQHMGGGAWLILPATFPSTLCTLISHFAPSSLQSHGIT